MLYKALLVIFLVLMIPNMIVYAIHGYDELEEAYKNMPVAATEHKGNEQFAEGIFFTVILIGYMVTTILVIAYPRMMGAYYVILFGTVVIIIIYYLSKTVGFPAPDFYDNMIVDDTTNWKDVITKVAQQAFVIPLSMMLILKRYNIK